MKVRTSAIATFAATLALLSAASSASADTLPKRKAGLWEVSVAQVGSPAPGHTMKQCIDEETDKKMQATGTEMVEKMGGKCTKNDLQKTATGYEGSADCMINGSHMISTSTFAGDFESKYSGKIVTTFDPPMMGTSNSTTTMEAKYLGQCEAGMVPGDMVLPNGMKVNANTMMNQGAPPVDAKKLGQLMKDRAAASH